MTEPTLPRFTFVVTYGRSGSTLVQGLVNTLPRTLLRGENNMFMLPLFRSWSAMRDVNKKYGEAANGRGVQSAFYGIDEFRPDAFTGGVRDLVLPQLYGSVEPADVDVLGFKEVHWERVGTQETDAFFDFFDQVFPGARYVLHRREHDQVTTSGFWRNQAEDSVMQALLRVEAIQDRLRETRPERTFDTRYERLTSEDPAVVDAELRGLAEFVLGSCDDELRGRMRQALQLGYGPNPFGRSKRPRKRGAKGGGNGGEERPAQSPAQAPPLTAREPGPPPTELRGRSSEPRRPATKAPRPASEPRGRLYRWLSSVGRAARTVESSAHR